MKQNNDLAGAELAAAIFTPADELMAILRRLALHTDDRRSLMLAVEITGTLVQLRGRLSRLRCLGMPAEAAEKIGRYWDQIDDAMRAAIWEAGHPSDDGEGVSA